MDDEYKPTAKGMLIPIFRAGALILFLTLVMLIGGRLNESWGFAWLTGLIEFLEVYLGVIAGFVVLISIWDYLYPFYRDQKPAKYLKPLIEAIGITFGLWLVLEFIARLAYFVPDPSMSAFLTTGLDMFFEFFALVFILILLIYYGNALRTDQL